MPKRAPHKLQTDFPLDSQREAPTTPPGVARVFDVIRLGAPPLDALAVARRSIETRPYCHAGFERFAIAAGMMLDAEDAQAAGAKAVAAAPQCDMAHRSCAYAAVAAGDLDTARRHAEYAVRLDALDHLPARRWEHMLLSTLDGDAAAVDRYLETLAPDHAERSAPYLQRLRE